jgi:esterase/lipase
MQLQTNYEITESVVQAQDFAVQIKNLPDHDNVRSLKATMWNWLENVNQKDHKRLNNPSGVD